MRASFLSLAILVSCFAGADAQTSAAALAGEESPQPLRPTSLLNWLKIIDLEEYRLLTAVDQHGYYFAVKRDADGDILFCNYDYRKSGVTSFRLEIIDDQGQDLGILHATKKSPKSILLRYETHAQIGPLKTTASTTIAYPAGHIYTLKKHDLDHVRVRYMAIKDGRDSIVFDQSVRLAP